MLSVRRSVVLMVSAFLAIGSGTTGRADPQAGYEKTRQDFLKLLDRPRVPADVKSLSGPAAQGGLVRSVWSFASEKKSDGTMERVPVLEWSPARRAAKLPVMIVLHGTGGSKTGVESWVKEFAERGFCAIAVDARYHGDRVPGSKGSSAYVAAVTRAWRSKAGEPQEHPFFYDTVYDLWRLLDVLEKRADLDAKRIGMLGISMGGIQTWMAGAVDDRVAVALPLIAVQSFRWSLEKDRWQGRVGTVRAAHEAAAKDLGESAVNGKVVRAVWEKILPGILDRFDCPAMLPMFAGRPLFIASGTEDGNCPYDGARIAIHATQKAYDARKAEDRLMLRINEGVGHKVTDDDRKSAVEFAVKWLKP